MASGAAMLPLIVGQIEEAAETPQEDAEIIEPEAEDNMPGADISEADESDEDTNEVAPIANADAPPADYIAEETSPEELRKDAT